MLEVFELTVVVNHRRPQLAQGQSKARSRIPNRIVDPPKPCLKPCWKAFRTSLQRLSTTVTQDVECSCNVAWSKVEHSRNCAPNMGLGWHVDLVIGRRIIRNTASVAVTGHQGPRDLMGMQRTATALSKTPILRGTCHGLKTWAKLYSSNAAQQ